MKDFLSMVAEMKCGHTMKIEQWGEEFVLKLTESRYRNNGNLAIQLYCLTDDEYWEPFATLTTNTDRKHKDEYFATIDTNNCPFAEQLIEDFCLGTHTGLYEFSGYCSYPIYHMNKEALKWFAY